MTNPCSKPARVQAHSDRWAAVQAARARCRPPRPNDPAWWHDPDLWDDDGPSDGVDRPTENAAIARVRRQAQRHTLTKMAELARVQRAPGRFRPPAPPAPTPEDVA